VDADDVYEGAPTPVIAFYLLVQNSWVCPSNPSNDNSLSLITGVAVYLHRLAVLSMVLERRRPSSDSMKRMLLILPSLRQGSS